MKRFAIFPGTRITKLFPSRESLVCDIPAGYGKSLTFFTVGVSLLTGTVYIRTCIRMFFVCCTFFLILWPKGTEASDFLKSTQFRMTKLDFEFFSKIRGGDLVLEC
jgi:hypothetical protein